jgi:hypothetical protein
LVLPWWLTISKWQKEGPILIRHVAIRDGWQDSQGRLWVAPGDSLTGNIPFGEQVLIDSGQANGELRPASWNGSS